MEALSRRGGVHGAVGAVADRWAARACAVRQPKLGLQPHLSLRCDGDKHEPLPRTRLPSEVRGGAG